MPGSTGSKSWHSISATHPAASKDLWNALCKDYLDDVLVYSRTFDAHLEHLRLVFERFREAGLKLKPSKCHFGQKKVKFLGHVISKDGVRPDPAKVSAIKEDQVPRSVKDVRAFFWAS